MHNDDPNMLVETGTPIDPADFGRIRVAKILRSEKPLFEQEEAGFNLHVEEMVRMLGIPDNVLLTRFKGRLLFAGYGIKRGHSCKIDMRDGEPIVGYRARKRGFANLNSRYLGHLSR